MAGFLTCFILFSLPILLQNSGKKKKELVDKTYSCGNSFGVTPNSLLTLNEHHIATNILIFEWSWTDS